jgi:transcriptional regulator with XRE-family HTH domain
MTNTLHRVVALLLVPCLIGDPIVVSASSFAAFPTVQTTPKTTAFHEQALTASLAGALFFPELYPHGFMTVHHWLVAFSGLSMAGQGLLHAGILSLPRKGKSSSNSKGLKDPIVASRNLEMAWSLFAMRLEVQMWKKLSVREISQRSGISNSRLSELRQGLAFPTGEELDRLTKTLFGKKNRTKLFPDYDSVVEMYVMLQKAGLLEKKEQRRLLTQEQRLTLFRFLTRSKGDLKYLASKSGLPVKTIRPYIKAHPVLGPKFNEISSVPKAPVEEPSTIIPEQTVVVQEEIVLKPEPPMDATPREQRHRERRVRKTAVATSDQENNKQIVLEYLKTLLSHNDSSSGNIDALFQRISNVELSKGRNLDEMLNKGTEEVKEILRQHFAPRLVRPSKTSAPLQESDPEGISGDKPKEAIESGWRRLLNHQSSGAQKRSSSELDLRPPEEILADLQELRDQSNRVQAIIRAAETLMLQGVERYTAGDFDEAKEAIVASGEQANTALQAFAELKGRADTLGDPEIFDIATEQSLNMVSLAERADRLRNAMVAIETLRDKDLDEADQSLVQAMDADITNRGDVSPGDLKALKTILDVFLQRQSKHGFDPGSLVIWLPMMLSAGLVGLLIRYIFPGMAISPTLTASLPFLFGVSSLQGTSLFKKHLEELKTYLALHPEAVPNARGMYESAANAYKDLAPLLDSWANRSTLPAEEFKHAQESLLKFNQFTEKNATAAALVDVDVMLFYRDEIRHAVQEPIAYMGLIEAGGIVSPEDLAASVTQAQMHIRATLQALELATHKPPKTGKSRGRLRFMHTDSHLSMMYYDQLQFVHSFEGIYLKLDTQLRNAESDSPKTHLADRLEVLLYEALRQLDSVKDPVVRKLISSYFDRNPRQICIKVAKNLPVNAARSQDDEGHPVIILSEVFVRSLLDMPTYLPTLENSKWDAPFDSKGVGGWILAERLFHELGHSDIYGNDEEEENEEIAQIYSDFLLFKHHTQHLPLAKEIVRYFKYGPRTFTSGNYFGVNGIMGLLLDNQASGRSLIEKMQFIGFVLRPYYETNTFPAWSDKVRIRVKYMPDGLPAKTALLKEVRDLKETRTLLRNGIAQIAHHRSGDKELKPILIELEGKLASHSWNGSAAALTISQALLELLDSEKGVTLEEAKTLIGNHIVDLTRRIDSIDEQLGKPASLKTIKGTNIPWRYGYLYDTSDLVQRALNLAPEPKNLRRKAWLVGKIRDKIRFVVQVKDPTFPDFKDLLTVQDDSHLRDTLLQVQKEVDARIQSISRPSSSNESADVSLPELKSGGRTVDLTRAGLDPHDDPTKQRRMRAPWVRLEDRADKDLFNSQVRAHHNTGKKGPDSKLPLQTPDPVERNRQKIAQVRGILNQMIPDTQHDLDQDRKALRLQRALQNKPADVRQGLPFDEIETAASTPEQVLLGVQSKLVKRSKILQDIAREALKRNIQASELLTYINEQLGGKSEAAKELDKDLRILTIREILKTAEKPGRPRRSLAAQSGIRSNHRPSQAQGTGASTLIKPLSLRQQEELADLQTYSYIDLLSRAVGEPPAVVAERLLRHIYFTMHAGARLDSGYFLKNILRATQVVYSSHLEAVYARKLKATWNVHQIHLVFVGGSVITLDLEKDWVARSGPARVTLNYRIADLEKVLAAVPTSTPILQKSPRVPKMFITEAVIELLRDFSQSWIGINEYLFGQLISDVEKVFIKVSKPTPDLEHRILVRAHNFFVDHGILRRSQHAMATAA